MNRSSLPTKKRKLDSDFGDENNSWDDDDIFTADQLQELDLLATQPIEGNPSSSKCDQSISFKSKRASSSSDDVKRTVSDNDELEKLKTLRYSLEGEAKILRETLHRKSNEIALERLNKQREQEQLVKSYEDQILYLKKSLQRSKTELEFKERERKDVVDQLREVKAKHTNGADNSVVIKKIEKPVPKSSLLSANKFSDRFAFDSKKEKETSNVEVAVQTDNGFLESSLMTLEIDDLDAESELAIKLFNEIQVVTRLECTEEHPTKKAYTEIIKSINIFVNCMDSFKLKNDASSQEKIAFYSSSSLYSRLLGTVLSHMQLFTKHLITNDSSHDHDSSKIACYFNQHQGIFIFIIKIFQLFIEYSNQYWEPDEQHSLFIFFKNVGMISLMDSIVSVVSHLSKQDDDFSVLNTHILECLSTFISLSDEKTILSFSQLLCNGILQTSLKRCLKTETFYFVVQIIERLCRLEENLEKLCSKSNSCILLCVGEALNELVKFSNDGSIIQQLVQMMLTILRSKTGVDVINSQCHCVSKIVQSIINLILIQLKKFNVTKNMDSFRLIRSGFHLLRLISFLLNDFKSVRAASENKYIVLVSNLIQICKSSSLFTDREVLLIQELYDFNQDDCDYFEVDKQESSVSTM